MSNMNKRLRDKLYPLIKAKIGGEFCCDCGADLFSLSESGKSDVLCIDHIDNNNNNMEVWNMQFLCKSCNTKKNHPRTTEPTMRDAPPEFIAGKKNYRKANKYVTGRLYDPVEHGALLYDTLIWDMCEFCDFSDTRAKGYIRRMCSRKHGLMTTEERSDGQIYVVWKNNEELDEVIRDSEFDEPKSEI